MFTFCRSNKNLFLITVITWFTVTVQFTALIVIISSYMMLIREISKAQDTIKQATSKIQSNSALVSQIIILISSNILSFLPSGIIYLSSLFTDGTPNGIFLCEY